jgi:hypothetical protein
VPHGRLVSSTTSPSLDSQSNCLPHRARTAGAKAPYAGGRQDYGQIGSHKSEVAEDDLKPAELAYGPGDEVKERVDGEADEQERSKEAHSGARRRFPGYWEKVRQEVGP